MMEAIDLYFMPELNNPSLVAGGPGGGEMAVTVARYLKDTLGAEEFGEIRSHDFFEPTAVRIRDNIVEEPEFPEGKFYFWKGEHGNDLIIFVGDAQPHTREYALVHLVLDVAEKFATKRVYTSLASPTHIYHTRKPKIYGAATNTDLIQEMENRGISPMGSGAIPGMNGMLLGMAKARELEGICLLSEVPIYTTELANPRAAKAIIEVLTPLLNTEIDMTQIDQLINKMDDDIERNVFHLMTSLREGAEEFVKYLDRLREQANTEEETPIEDLPGYSEELLKEVEQFLKDAQKGENDEAG